MVGMLKWWFIFVCSIFAIVALGVTGVLSKMWLLDHFKIMFFTLSAYFVCSIYIGILTFRVSNGFHDAYSRSTDTIAFAPDLMTQLGLIGTVVGFVMMLSGFILSTDINAILASATTATNAGSVALSNTLAGLICSVLVKVQTLNLNWTAEE